MINVYAWMINEDLTPIKINSHRLYQQTSNINWNPVEKAMNVREVNITKNWLGDLARMTHST